MSSKLMYAVLDTYDERQVAAYERALYRAFNGNDMDVQRRVRAFDRKTRRARPLVPYKNQQIYAGWIEDTIIAAVALNCTLSETLQLEMLGFSIDKTIPDVCEGLGLFSMQTFTGDTLAAYELGEFVSGHIHQQKIRTIFATCSQKRLRSYEILGYRPVDTRQFESGLVYLIRRDFSSEITK